MAVYAEKLTAIVAALEGGATKAAICRTFARSASSAEPWWTFWRESHGLPASRTREGFQAGKDDWPIATALDRAERAAWRSAAALIRPACVARIVKPNDW